MSDDARDAASAPSNPEEAGELLDVLDEDGQATGERKPRAEVHRDGDWHRAFHLWILDDEDRVLVQRRAPYKDLAGGKLDVTVGGHLRAGEYWPNALREVEEELGLPVDVPDVEPLGTFRSVRRYEHATDREVHEVFAMRSSWDLRSYVLNPREVDVLYAVPVAGAIRLWRDGIAVFAPGWDAQRRPSDALLHEGDLIAEGRDATVAALSALAHWAGLEVPAPAPEEP